MYNNISMYIIASLTILFVFTMYMKEVFGFKRRIFWIPLCWLVIELVGYCMGEEFVKTMAKAFSGVFTLLLMKRLLVYLILLQGVVCWMCKGSWKKKVFVFLFSFALCIVVGIGLILKVEQEAGEILYIAILYGKYPVVVILVQVLMFLFVEVIIFLKEIKEDFKTSLKNWSLILGVSIICFLIMYWLSINMVANYKTTTEKDFNMYFIFLGITIFLYSYYFISIGNHRKEIARKISEKQMDMYEEWYKGMQYTKNEMRSFRHDINNHFSVLSNLCELGVQGDKAKESLIEIKKYIENIGISLIPSSYDTDSGNLMLDAVIDLKKSYALSKGIGFQAEIHVPNQMTYHNVDLVVLLGNLLDNAIEACESFVHKRECKIVLKMQYRMKNLIIMIQNSYDGHMDGQSGILTEEETWNTTKKDKKNHGIGMQNVMNIVQKYNGMVEWNAEQGEFRMDLLLYEFDEKDSVKKP